MRRLRPVLRVALNLLGPAILLYILATTNLGDVWAALRLTRWWLVALSCALVVPFLMLKAWRWQLILRAADIWLPLPDATALYSIGIFLGIVTPGQAGDMVKAWYLRQRGYPLSTGLTSVVVDRLFDVGIMGSLAATGLYFFWDVLPGGKVLNVLVVAVLLVAVLVGLSLAGSARLRALVFGQLLPRVLPAGIQARLATLTGLALTPRQLAQVGAVSALGLALTFVRCYLLFLALGQPIAVGPFVALIAIIALVGTASPAGVGTRDGALVLGLAAILGQPLAAVRPLALSVSALLLLLNLLNILAGFLFSLRYPINEALAAQQA